MDEKIVGQFKVQLDILLDPEGELICYKVISPLFNGKNLMVMSENDVTEEIIREHLDTLGITYNPKQFNEWYPDSFFLLL
jgi:hypothetical protein